MSGIDKISQGAYIISDLHYRTHQGKVFETCNIFAGVADDANADILIKVGANKELHFVVAAASGGDSYFYLYETPTTSANGTSLAIINRDRDSAITSDATAFHTPTVSDVGTKLNCELVPGGTKNQAAGGITGTFAEWNLKVNTNYLIRLTNKAGVAKDISITPLWYEP